MDADRLLVELEQDPSGIMVTPMNFAIVVELWLPQLVFVEAGQDGELYVRASKFKPDSRPRPR